MAKKNAFAHLFPGATALGTTVPTPAAPAPGAAVATVVAEENDDDENNDTPPDNGKKGKKAKKAKRARRAEDTDDDDDVDADEGDDDTDAEDQDDEDKASARARERGRIAAIMSCGAAAANPVLALDLALHTAMTRNQVIGTLKRTSKAQGAPPAPAGTVTETTEAPISRLDSRMARERTAPVVAESAQGRPDANSVEGTVARLTAQHRALTGR